MTRASRVALTLALLLVGQSIGLPLVVALEEEQCESHGLKYNCVRQTAEEFDLQAKYDVGAPGAVNASTIPSPAVDWPTSFAPGIDVPGGVHVSGTMENLAFLMASAQSSAGMTTNDTPRWYNATGLQTLSTGAIHALQYSFRLNASQLMNGASEIYYRSPLQWNANYSAAYLDIVTLDAQGHENGLVAAARYMDSPAADDANDSLLANNRLYYHLSGAFVTGQIYTVNEYVVTKGSPPLALPELPVFMDEGQDVAGDGFHTTRLFPGHREERDFGYSTDPQAPFFELGWSLRAFVGMGAGGTVNIMFANSTVNKTKLLFENVRAPAHTNAGVQDANVLRLVIPLKTTQHILNSTITVYPYNSWADRQANAIAGGIGAISQVTIPDATGSIVTDVDLSSANWTGANATHWYRIIVELHLNSTTCPESNGAECTLVSYPTTAETLPDGTSNFHVQMQIGTPAAGNFVSRHVLVTQPWIDATEVHEASPTSADHTGSSDSGKTNWRTIIAGLLTGGIGIGLAVLAIVLVTAPISIPLMIITAGAAGVGAIVATSIGACELEKGARGMDLNACINPKFLEDLGKGIATLLAVTACGIALLPGIGVGARLAAGAACVASGAIVACDLITGQGLGECISDFVNAIGKVLRVVFAAVELVAQVLFFLLDHLKDILIFLFFAILLLSIPGLFKMGILAVLSLAYLFRFDIERPSNSPLYRRIFYRYIPIWSDVVERRLLHWNVHP